MRTFLHALGVYLRLAKETADERAAREEIEAHQAATPLAKLISDSCLRGVILGVWIALVFSILDGKLLTLNGAKGGALTALLGAMVFLTVRLPGRRRGARRREASQQDDRHR